MLTTKDIPGLALPNRTLAITAGALVLVGGIAFVVRLAGAHPELAWQAYLINFLLWSAAAQGGLLFSAVMHVAKARWSGPLAGLAEALAAFFPVSFILFLLLFAGSSHVFPWLHEDLHGKELWLNLPFLFSRDCLGLLVLYLSGCAYLYYTLAPRLIPGATEFKLRTLLLRGREKCLADPQRHQRQQTVWGILYIIAFALVLSLIGYDLVMSMDPHWYSTLFGAYSFIKAFFIGLGALIILAAVVHLRQGAASGLTPSHFHDVGKLFFAFCLLWADFFYVQLVVIWYGNIPEESVYVIERVLLPPWRPLAWVVFVICFIAPFLILLNQRVKSRPGFMIALCAVVLGGMWLEHLLLLAPALSRHASGLPLGAGDVLITLGFLGLMALAVAYFLNLFPEIVPADGGER